MLVFWDGIELFVVLPGNIEIACIATWICPYIYIYNINNIKTENIYYVVYRPSSIGMYKVEMILKIAQISMGMSSN